MFKTNKKAQEEMFGFILIIVIVAVILLFFLWFGLSGDKETSVESYKAESFISSVMQVTTRCEKNANKLDVRELIFSCADNLICSSGENSCEILKFTLSEALNNSWTISNESFYKAYEMSIISDGLEDNEILKLSEGAPTNTYKGALQSFSKSGEKVNINLRIYS